MSNLKNLVEIAYEKERVLSRRRAKRAGIAEETALLQTLEAVAGNRSLAELAAARRHEKLEQQAKIAARKKGQADARAQQARSKLPDADCWLAWFDGAAHPNPGKMGIGGLLQSPQGATTEISFMAGSGDSSEAEYIALIAVLQAAVTAQPAKLLICGDSRVVIDDVNAQAAGSAHVLRHQRAQARQLIAQLGDVTLRWIPRKKNAAADALSQQAIRALP